MGTIVLILFAAVLLILTGIGMYNMGRLSVKKTEDFRCLYCDTLVIGAKSLDKMTHILCIDRAPEDIEAMKRKAIVPEDEYFIEIKPVFKKVLPSSANMNSWRGSTAGWSTNEGRLYRNGEQIGTGWHAANVDVLRDRMNQEIELDKHKRRTQALR